MFERFLANPPTPPAPKKPAQPTPSAAPAAQPVPPNVNETVGATPRQPVPLTPQVSPSPMPPRQPGPPRANVPPRPASAPVAPVRADDIPDPDEDIEPVHVAQPPRARVPMDEEERPSTEVEVIDEEEEPQDGAEFEGRDDPSLDELEDINDDEDPETALPVDDEQDEDIEPPEPPSFLKAPPRVREFSSVEAADESAEEEPEKDAPVDEKKTEAVVANEQSVPKDGQHTEKTVATGQERVPQVDEKDIVRGESLHTVDFADIWFTPEGVAYVRDKNTRFALTPIETDDLDDFHTALEQGFTGTSSYAVKFGGDSYRVERVNTVDGLQFNCRKMPTTTPEIETLGFAPAVVKHLTSLSRASGLLLFAGPTGQGKTTTVSALMKRFLDTDGGFLYTIEDPPEMPLSGIYHSKNGGLGLCKQVPVENDQWGAGLRSALRSKPRYILVGEIRTPETASQCLVAATSGHLVLSTIHANGVEDALNSMIKYAASTGLDNSLVADLLARGILGVVHQRLEGTNQLHLVYESAFANPNSQAACQMRMAIRDTNINLATFMEQQKTRMDKGLPMFRD